MGTCRFHSKYVATSKYISTSEALFTSRRSAHCAAHVDHHMRVSYRRRNRTADAIKETIAHDNREADPRPGRRIRTSFQEHAPGSHAMTQAYNSAAGSKPPGAPRREDR